MTIRNSSNLSASQNQSKAKKKAAKLRMRQMLLEQLENRQLLTVGPQLIGIQPNNSDLIIDGSVRQQSPRELTFRFDDSQAIHPSTLDGIRITAAGGDGTFALATASSDLGTGGEVDVQFTAAQEGLQPTLAFTATDLGAGVAPTVSVNGTDVSVTLNSNVTTPTTAEQLVLAINGSPAVAVVNAKVNGGIASAPVGNVDPAGYSPIALTDSGDVQIVPGRVVIGDRPDENEVTIRFGETLANDRYRVEIFGFDDPVQGIVGLRNTDASGAPGDLFVPSDSNTRKDTIDFRLDLGPQVTAVVPQPVIRDASGALTQERDTIVVHFDGDKLLVENDSAGNPTPASAENPEFYQLIFTSDTVRNTDDLRFLPTVVTYNASANTATLKFAQDLDTLAGSNAGPSTFRLRIGTRETTPIAPVFSEAAATAISDFNTGGAARFRFTARELGESGSGLSIEVINSNSGGAPLITAAGRVLTIDLASDTVTAAELLEELQTSSAASDLFSIQLEPGSDPSVVLNTPINYSPISVVGLGSSFDTAADLGVLGSADIDQTSLVLTSEINAVPFEFDLPGASDDLGHRSVPREFEDHINDLFGADSVDGITTIFYNFQRVYGTDSTGQELTNAITAKQQDRAREALQIWSNQVGVQFIETPDQGITIATGAFSALNGTPPNVVIQNSINTGVRIDPTFEDSLLVLEASRQWGDNYGEDWFRAALTGMGMLLGLERAADLPSGTLMALSTNFINAGNSNAQPADEPVFPGVFDSLHGQHLFRNDSNDIDLYKFEVDFGDDEDRVGLFVAETMAERLTNSSSLDSLLHLYRQTQASAESNLAADRELGVRFDAVQPGLLGNNLQIFVSRSDRGPGAGVIVNTFDNLVTVDLNSTPGSETTAQELIDALNADPSSAALVRASLATGSGSTVVGNREITYSPIVLDGGDIELISRNDDYFSEDSQIKQSLSSGTYYLGVSASGNDSYDPVIEDTGFGGGSQGKYDLRLTFRAQVDTTDAIRDVEGTFVGDEPVIFDGDADGTPGGTYNFWFQTRPLDRTLDFTAGGSADLDGKLITLTGANGIVRRFEFDSDNSVGIGNTPIPFTLSDTAGSLADSLASAIRSRPDLGVSAVANGTRLVLQGERSIQLSPDLNNLTIGGRTIFVDKSAGPNADGSLERPFNNIAGVGVPNAFSVAQPGDIVRIVGNGGGDGDLATVGDNLAYEIGFGLINGGPLSDGSTMEVPKGVTTMIDAGAVFKLRRSRIGIGSSSLGVDRSGGALQVLGTPNLLDSDGSVLRDATGAPVPGSVYFTSWQDESIGQDTYAPQTTPSTGDWGGISYRNDVDAAAGRRNLEDEGIFLQYVNHADIRFGGGGNVVIDSVQQVVNPIRIVDMRPTVTFNRISNSADAAMSASPDSFEETNFHEPSFQLNGAFTSDYQRVGPEIHHNQLVNNSLNGLFVSVETPAGDALRPLNVSARFDDIDIPHIISENVSITGTPGGAFFETTQPLANLVALQPQAGGQLLPGTYNYKITFVDRFGYETPASEATSDIDLNPGQTAVQLIGLPLTSGEFVARRIYRSQSNGGGLYELVGQVDALSGEFTDIGQEAGGVLVRDRADLSGLALIVDGTGGTLDGTYNYVLAMVDEVGRPSIASDPSADIAVTGPASVDISNIPLTQPGFAGRYLYRSAPGGNGPYVLVAVLGSGDSNFKDDGSFVADGDGLAQELPVTAFGTLRPRLDASLVIDPGAVIKLEGARIEIEQGASLLAEGTDGAPVVFTSKLDDRYGAGGTFDTNNDGSNTSAQPRDWGGIYASNGSTLSLDHAIVAYAGGVTKIEGTFKGFSPIEIQQADARIANSTFEFNEDGIGGQGPRHRLGRLDNRAATIFVRGAQPILIGNTFISNEGSAINIDANSLNADLLQDIGRSTGSVDRRSEFDSNRGPLVRENRLLDNELNGMEIRGDLLMVESVWDDTDIVHTLFNSITVTNRQHEGGLRLQSAPDESLVVKLLGYGSNFNEELGTGITATGFRTNANDRVGGTVEIIGQPGFPVVLTSFHDDTVGAGLQPDGTPQTDTNNNGIATIPRPADWRSVLLDQHSNDRNVATVLEIENPNAIAPGFNSTAATAQLLGDLADGASASDENLRLGFVVQGVLSEPTDVDVYSFTAVAGTEVWLDVDDTTQSLDMVIELLNANGELLARSDNSNVETNDPNQIVKTPAIASSLVNPLNSATGEFRTNASGTFKEDGSINPRDAGLRVRLPGAAGTRTTFHFRVRSASTNPEDFNAGLTSGSYEVQVRQQENQEFPGSTIQYADIRYATNGVHLRGLPAHSPLLGEFQEDESAIDRSYANNDPNVFSDFRGVRDQYLGNLLGTDRATISIGGELSSGQDLDFYRFDVDFLDLTTSTNGLTAPVVFDLDYADGLNRADTSLSVFEVAGNQYRLVYYAENSNIADDIRGPLSLTDIDDLSRGTVGPNDPYIGSVELPVGQYAVAVSSAARQPAALLVNGVRRQPISSLANVIEDRFDSVADSAFDFAAPAADPLNLWHISGGSAAFRTNGSGSITDPGAAGDLVANFDLGAYSALDIPKLYFDYTFVSDLDDRFQAIIRDADGNETVLATLNPGGSQRIIDLAGFAGQNDLDLIFRYNTNNANANGNSGATVDNVIIGFAERGEEIINAPASSAFAGNPVAPNTLLSGEYQLEIRQGDRLGPDFDTNDRSADQVTLIAPSGADLVDGDVFRLRDAGAELVFEFTLDGSVTPGNVAISFTDTDPANLIAERIRDAINQPGVQSRLDIQAASRGGAESGPTGDAGINLFGRVFGDFGKVGVIYHEGQADQNTNRDQGQVLISNNFIRHSRDYGVWTEPGDRQQDPRDLIRNIDPFIASAMSDIPALVGNAPGAVRNLRELNDDIIGGFNTGIVVSNNVLESGGLGGVHVAGETPIWMITPLILPPPRDGTGGDHSTDGSANPVDHFGTFLDDRDLLVIDSGRTRVQFEFEDIAGAPTGGPTFGSGTAGGNGWDDQSVPIYYREDNGAVYLRFAPTNPGYSALETVQSIRDSIFGSILTTNGTTQNVRATVAPTLLNPDPFAVPFSNPGYINYFNRPALYLEGVTNINFVNRNGGGNPFDIRRVDVASTPQPFLRAVNNTVYGNDGRASFAADTTVAEENDTIDSAVETWQGTAQNPRSFQLDATIGDSPLLPNQPSRDVDFYKFKLDVGERAIIDIDSPTTSTLDSVLQIFDASGRLQEFSTPGTLVTTISDNDAAPGELESLDPYADFTATKAGVYYVAVSSAGNSTFDPASLGGRTDAPTTGDYSIDLMVLHPQEFTITVEDVSQYAQGDTFTIHQVSDFADGTNSRTFEFTFGGAVQPGNIPINVDANYRAPDVARAIAGAINGGGPGGSPALPNEQELPNGDFALASPLDPVEATALGGIDGVEAGLTLFGRRPDGVFPTHSGRGIGHDRTASGRLSNTSAGDGTTERFVAVKNAAYITSNGNILVDPDNGANHNLDQLLPETGILVSAGASPTLMNNVFVNVQTPIISEETRVASLAPSFGNRTPVPFGTGVNAHPKPGEVIVGGSIYQFAESATANNRLIFGIEASPTNVPNTGLDFNTTVPPTEQIFVDAQASQFLPAPGSPIIDSSLDSLEEREAFRTIKEAVGISVSPVIAPSRDATGQLRVDDPTVAPPNGQGADVFKDRGALDRADFVGPSAEAVRPLDNDANNVDSDEAISVIQLTSGVFPEFRVQLVDGFELADPFPGIGIDDSRVVGPVTELRNQGAVVTLFENGRLLTEGIDYRFSYDSTKNEVILTPLAGVWKNDRVYEIAINNKDRFVVFAPAGDQVSDEDFFTVTDEDGGVVFFEFDSGYRLQAPQGLTLEVPLAGGAAGGVADGDRFSIEIAGDVTTFEFDRNGNFLAGNVPIAFEQGASQSEITDVVLNAIQASGLAVTPRLLPGGRIFLGAEAGVRVDTTFTAIDQPPTTVAFKMPALGPRPGGIVDGQTFTISDGRREIVFEYDSDGLVAVGNLAIDFSSATTADDLAIITRDALAASPLNVSPVLLANDLVYIGLSPNGNVDTGTSRLTLNGVSRTIADGETFVITTADGTATFEFTRDGSVASGNVAIPYAVTETQDEVGARIAAVITNAGLGLLPDHVGDGNIAVGGEEGDVINVDSAPGMSLFGLPGVRPNTQLRVFGPLLLQVPVGGASQMVENSTFTLTGNGRTVTFEYDSDFSGASQPGNIVIRYGSLSTATSIGADTALAIRNAGLGINAVHLGNGQISLGQIDAGAVNVGNTGLTASRGVVTDGETFTLSNGVSSVTFEFDNVDLGNGFDVGNSPILFSSASTPESVVASMKAVIEGSSLGLTTEILPGGVIQLNDTPRYVIDTTNAPTLVRSGVPGGAQPISFIQGGSFTGEDMKKAIIDAVSAAMGTDLIAKDRGGNTLFLENAQFLSSQIESYFLKGVADLAGNLLKPNRINNETEFTILMPGVTLDYGDAPDPFTTTTGRYPTRKISDGARHVVGTTALLGSTIDADDDGQPTVNADGDNDDGVTFSQNFQIPAMFNRNITTTVDVTLNSPGFVDGWIDFNADGDWDDPGEQILTSVEFRADSLTQSFEVTVPASAPVPSAETITFARFRSSDTGGLTPTGLAVAGEVEDYKVTIVPGTPPTAVDDTYSLDEDSFITTTDADGNNTPGFFFDDGVAANDTDPEGGPLGVTQVEGPKHAALFSLESDGTFSYTPEENFFGTDTFTYRVNDGVLNSNNIATVTIVVNEINDTPIVENDALTINEDEVLTIDPATLLGNDDAGPFVIDPITNVKTSLEPDQTLTITSVSPLSAESGSVRIVNGQVVYTPRSDFRGVDTFTYVATDDGTSRGIPTPLSAVGTVTITVLDKNDPPITVPKEFEITEDTDLTDTVAALLAGDTPGPADESGQTLSFVRVQPTSTNGGTVTSDGTNFTYTPSADFVGVDTFFYEVVDNGQSNGVADPQTSVGTVTVTVTNVNDAPRVQNPFGTITVAEDSPARIIDLQTIFFDPDTISSSDALSFSLVAGGNSNESLVTPSITGSQLTLQLLPDQNGQATIVVEAEDLAGETVRDTLTLNVTPVNDAPRLVESIPDFSFDEDSTIPGIVLTPRFFFDPDVSGGDQLRFDVVSNSNPLLVTPTISGDTLNMVLANNQSGSAVITIRATDNDGQTVSDQFTLLVRPINDVPETNPDTYEVPQGETLTTTDALGIIGDASDDGVLANDSDAEGSAMTAVLVRAPANATFFSLSSNGTFTYQHDGNSRNPDTFTYRASDGTGQSVETTVTINIGAPPAPEHQNPANNLDVNADGFISPIDALLVINFLNANGGGTPVGNLPAPPPFRDVDGNNIITANDALQVINALNNSSGGGEGEGASFGSLDVGLLPEGLLGVATPEVSTEAVVGSPVVNRRYGVRKMEGNDLYGPALPTQLPVQQEAENLYDLTVDLDWVEDDRESEQDPPEDLAIASLLDDLSDL